MSEKPIRTVQEAREHFEAFLTPSRNIRRRSLKELMETTEDIIFLKTNTILDGLLGEGIAKKSVSVVMGGTGDGKSLLLTHLAMKLSSAYKLLYISFENTDEVDNARFKDCINTYSDANISNITYVNLLEDEVKGFVDISKIADIIDKIIKPLAEEDNYDMILIDALQTATDKTDQADIHAKGNELISNLYKISVEKESPIIISWQGARGAANKKLEGITLDDTSGSIGTMRYASNVFFIKREEGSRKVKLLKARENKNASWDKPIEDLEMSLRFSVEKIF